MTFQRFRRSLNKINHLQQQLLFYIKNNNHHHRHKSDHLKYNFLRNNNNHNDLKVPFFTKFPIIKATYNRKYCWSHFYHLKQQQRILSQRHSRSLVYRFTYNWGGGKSFRDVSGGENFIYIGLLKKNNMFTVTSVHQQQYQREDRPRQQKIITTQYLNHDSLSSHQLGDNKFLFFNRNTKPPLSLNTSRRSTTNITNLYSHLLALRKHHQRRFKNIRKNLYTSGCSSFKNYFLSLFSVKHHPFSLLKRKRNRIIYIFYLRKLKNSKFVSLRENKLISNPQQFSSSSNSSSYSSSSSSSSSSDSTFNYRQYFFRKTPYFFVFLYHLFRDLRISHFLSATSGSLAAKILSDEDIMSALKERDRIVKTLLLEQKYELQENNNNHTSFENEHPSLSNCLVDTAIAKRRQQLDLNSKNHQYTNVVGTCATRCKSDVADNTKDALKQTMVLPSTDTDTTDIAAANKKRNHNSENNLHSFVFPFSTTNKSIKIKSFHTSKLIGYNSSPYHSHSNSIQNETKLLFNDMPTIAPLSPISPGGSAITLVPSSPISFSADDFEDSDDYSSVFLSCSPQDTLLNTATSNLFKNKPSAYTKKGIKSSESFSLSCKQSFSQKKYSEDPISNPSLVDEVTYFSIMTSTDTDNLNQKDKIDKSSLKLPEKHENHPEAITLKPTDSSAKETHFHSNHHINDKPKNKTLFDSIKQLLDSYNNAHVYSLALFLLKKSKGASNRFNHAIYMLDELGMSGHAPAHFTLGVVYQHGLFGLEKNLSLAMDYFKMASVCGHLDAMFNLSLLYMTVEPYVFENEACVMSHYERKEKAIELLKICATHGHKKASKVLETLQSQNVSNTKTEKQKLKDGLFISSSSHLESNLVSIMMSKMAKSLKKKSKAEYLFSSSSFTTASFPIV